MKRLVLSAALVAGASVLPFAQANAGTVLFSGSQSNTNAPGAAGGRCAGLTVNIHNTAPFFSTGLSDLGSFSTDQSHCLDAGPPLAPGAPATPYYDGLFTYTFADGATLFGDYSGLLTNGGAPGLVLNHQDFTVAGGSGRFAGATGAFSGDGAIHFVPGAPPIANLAFRGEISAPGIPEPAAWAVLLLGFGGLGAQLRRRRAGREACAA